MVDCVYFDTYPVAVEEDKTDGYFRENLGFSTERKVCGPDAEQESIFSIDPVYHHGVLRIPLHF